jgi:signal transduction histidine kinase
VGWIAPLCALDPSWLPLWIVLSLVFYFLPALIFAFIPVLVIASVLFVLFSLVIIGGFTRGLETLVAECAALRGRNYDARLVVHGEDEVAQLQLEFNDVTKELQHVLGALRAERDSLRAGRS